MRREGSLFTEGYLKMKLKAVSGTIPALLLVSALTFAFDIQCARSQHPNELIINKTGNLIEIENRFYRLKMTSYIRDLYVGGEQVTATWDILDFEENYNMQWKIETFVSSTILYSDEIMALIRTQSSLYTQNLTKYWVFFSDRPYFVVKLVREYLFDSWDVNNQLIFDVLNSEYYYTDYNGTITKHPYGSTPRRNLPVYPMVKVHSLFPFWAYQCSNGTCGFIVLGSNQLKTLFVKCGHPTEVQIDFVSAHDRTAVSHPEGRTEELLLLFYASGGSEWSEIRDLSKELFSDYSEDREMDPFVSMWPTFCDRGKPRPHFFVSNYQAIKYSAWKIHGLMHAHFLNRYVASMKLLVKNGTTSFFVGDEKNAYEENDFYAYGSENFGGNVHWGWRSARKNSLEWNQTIYGFEDSDKFLVEGYVKALANVSLGDVIFFMPYRNVSTVRQLNVTSVDLEYEYPGVGWVGTTIIVSYGGDGPSEMNSSGIFLHLKATSRQENISSGTLFTYKFVVWSHEGVITTPSQITPLHYAPKALFEEYWVNTSEIAIPPYTSATQPFLWFMNFSHFVAYSEGKTEVEFFMESAPLDVLVNDSSTVFTYENRTCKFEIQKGVSIIEVWTQIHDVAVANIVVSPMTMSQGQFANIDVTVQNQGSFLESFNVTTHYNSQVIETQTVSLDANASTILTYIWDTAGVNKGDYIISAEANAVPDETDTADNTKAADGMVTILSLGHDIAIKSITLSKTVVGQGYSLPIDVIVKNYGSFTENINVTAYCEANSIATQHVTLSSGNSTTATFTWNTTDVPYGNYSISAYASPVPGEADTADNVYIDGSVRVVRIQNSVDINGDGIVNVLEILIVALAFGSYLGHPNWNPIADLNQDGIINILDIVIIAVHFGETV